LNDASDIGVADVAAQDRATRVPNQWRHSDLTPSRDAVVGLARISKTGDEATQLELLARLQ
jgi:hypothetical protein